MQGQPKGKGGPQSASAARINATWGGWLRPGALPQNPNGDKLLLGDADGEAVAVLLDVGVQLLVNVRVQLVDGLHGIVSVGVRLAL